MMRSSVWSRRLVPVGALVLLPLAAVQPAGVPGFDSAVRFEVALDPKLPPDRPAGRVIVVLAREGSSEPRLRIGETGMDAPIIAATDADPFTPATPVTIDGDDTAFPVESLDRIRPGAYRAQAVFDTNIDLRSVNAPGNLYSDPMAITLQNGKPATVSLRLSRKVPPEQLPAPTDHVRYVRIQSQLLTDFHKRPIFLRAGIVLPRGFEDEVSRRYPLRVRIGGYGEKFTAVEGLMRSGSPFRSAWLADDSPRMLLLHLDGDGPFGDPYQVNSATNGPYGDAITQELIPYVERTFRGIGRPEARILEGGSTGGWASLALQIFYPDYFNGVWSFCPDSVDFRAFELLDIYSEANAYVNKYGFERPAARDTDGNVRFTMRHECQMENVLGAGNSWHLSGEQWGAWNATYGPRGSDGRPVPLWDARTGELKPELTEHWKQYDLRLVLERNWDRLGPKLRGKINIWIGDADTYFLNNGVHLLETFFARAEPPYGGRIVFGPRQGHCWQGLSEREAMMEMGRRTAAF